MLSVSSLFSKGNRFGKNNTGLTCKTRLYSDGVKVPINLIKELREKTKAGIQDCRTALIESGLNVGEAEKWLIKMSKATVQKKQGRIVSEGVLASVAQGTKISVVEVLQFVFV